MGPVDRKPVHEAELDGREQHLEDIGAQAGQHADDDGQHHEHLRGAQTPREVEEPRRDPLGMSDRLPYVPQEGLHCAFGKGQRVSLR